jgi:pyridoxal phosphate enzyme (YggS family)
MSLIQRYRSLQRDIAAIAASQGRRETAAIIAVSKTFPPQTIQEAIDAGINLFGENKVQEAKKKIPELKGAFSFHMIGHLQSNKARDAVRLFDLIHSIDRSGTLASVNEEAKKIGKRQDILLQVNITGEETKSGADPRQTLALAGECGQCDNVSLRGLMAMAPFTDDEDLIRRVFRGARLLLQEINETLGLNLTELSMGMSSDYRIAVEEGATLVRIGSAIFGERN